MRSSAGRRAAWGLVAILALDLAASAGWLIAAVATAPQDRDGDAIAILWGDSGRLAGEGVRRLGQALALWHSGNPSRLVFCVGGARPSTGFWGARVLCDRLAAAGVPVDRLRVGTGSNDTVSNLREIAELARNAGVRRIVVVSDPLQTLRIRLLLHKAGDAPATSWAPYDYRTALPRPGLVFLWGRAQHEFLAMVSLLLPDGLRRRLIDRLRP